MTTYFDGLATPTMTVSREVRDIFSACRIACWAAEDGLRGQCHAELKRALAGVHERAIAAHLMNLGINPTPAVAISNAFASSAPDGILWGSPTITNLRAAMDLMREQFASATWA